ncbi:hypothetical protein FRP1_29835 (plasmid) [Pseudonocardia sp. EC080625-04]|uniref:hypothetical protein n=1 Tax=Pseudonocardia sp. EC080625-04 TaxID=1096868 RepID=UPI0006CB55A4|nr:hypothetical protein [Pseudonocardia sp. EC080625-04]ALE76944.1 hypothetical protein FRP1_29835 [Pseudonocardia sp. EC080625-04]
MSIGDDEADEQEMAETMDVQEMAIALCDGFTPHDVIGLAELDRDALITQYEARQVLFDYLDALWDRAKHAGGDPATDPRFTAVAGLRDLAQELLGNAENAGGSD